MAKATIVEVARVAGVSVASVSNHLNGRHERMRPETRARIDEAIQALKFRPNGVARQLKTGHSSVLGLLVPTVSNPYYGQFAASVEQAAQRRGYRVMLGNTLRDPQLEQDFAAEFALQGVRGLIFGWANSSPETLAAIARGGTAVVALDMRRGQLPEGEAQVDLVTLDNRAAGRVAVEHLVALGHRRIGFVTGPGEARSRMDRRAGFADAIRAHGLGEPLVLVGEPPGADRFGDTDLAEMGRRAAAGILALSPRPTALIALNDMTAAGLMAGLREGGLSVPEQMSVVGVDDANFARWLNPPLTTVHQPTAEMAEASVAQLTERLGGTPAASRETIFAPKLVLRGSTAPPGAAAGG
jgi:DNA-binding LacI/PurR family transcriptional regulator